MSILKNGEVGTIICYDCGANIHFANKNELSPKIIDFKDITCSGCIEIIDNIKLEDNIVILNIEKTSR